MSSDQPVGWWNIFGDTNQKIAPIKFFEDAQPEDHSDIFLKE